MRPTIFLDLDGVCANFVDAACHLHWRPGYHVTNWNWFKEWGITGEEFWGPIKAHDDFYSLVKPYLWLQDITGLCNRFGDVVIATDNPLHVRLSASKTAWILRNIGSHLPVQMGPLKKLFAAPGRVLIDDSDDNVSDWQKAGGSAILFPQPWNAGRKRLEHTMHDIRTALERVADGH